MADFGALMAGLEPLIKKQHPHNELEFDPNDIFKTVGISNNEKKVMAEGGQEVMTMLDELSVVMDRLTQHNGSPGVHRLHPSHSQCCRQAAPPCCHHDHGPKGVSGCHHHGARERRASHHHDHRGPCNNHRGQRGPNQMEQCCQHAAPPPCCHHDHGPRNVPGCHHRGARERRANHHHESRGPCDLHHRGQRGTPQMEESSDDEDNGAASSEPPSSWRVCGVCYNNYNMTIRRPTNLMCGHTFCRKCLGEIAARGPLRCPICKAYERRPAAALPTNVVLMAALED